MFGESVEQLPRIQRRPLKTGHLESSMPSVSFVPHKGGTRLTLRRRRIWPLVCPCLSKWHCWRWDHGRHCRGNCLWLDGHKSLQLAHEEHFGSSWLCCSSAFNHDCKWILGVVLLLLVLKYNTKERSSLSFLVDCWCSDSLLLLRHYFRFTNPHKNVEMINSSHNEKESFRNSSVWWKKSLWLSRRLAPSFSRPFSLPPNSQSFLRSGKLY